ncbi:granzyme B [Lepisosteus oculatus]|uniref:granzyme B n=1 Tax=Lepisosteus oculatus TaxID=7918 RepID=UPI003716126E
MGFLQSLAAALSLLSSLSSAGLFRDGIIGGHEAQPHSRPYMAYLVVQRDKVAGCGGFLIREDFVVTAAHCAGRKLYVLLGAHALKKQESSRQVLDVQKQFPHEDYSEENLENDIMLLKLQANATLNRFVEPLALAQEGEEDPRERAQCLVSGWGSADADGENHLSELQEVNVTVVGRKRCDRDWRGGITDNMICTQARRGPCVGDSGSPLVCGGKAYGIVSFSTNPCNLRGFPHVYTRISTYQPWISKIISAN